MRWLYADPARAEEREYLQAVSAGIDAWWREFAAKTADLDACFRGKAQWDVPAWMERHLQAIDPRLMWEFGGAVHGPGHRLVITPESDRWLRPLVSTLLERAPALDGWELYAHRLPEDAIEALATVKARTGVEIPDATVEVLPEEHQRIALRYTFDACRSEEDQDAWHAAFVATESLLGEAVLDQWIGAIEAVPRRRSLLRFLKRTPDAGVPLASVRADVQARVDALRAALPDRPCIDRDDPWTLWKLEPTQADDYPGQADLFVGKSMDPAMWSAVRAGRAFFSDSFSRHGEVFCTVKLDGSEGIDEEAFADKSEIEDALDAALRETRAGCFIGGGTGLRYSYVDLALLDVERGIEIVRDVLRAGNIPRRSWIVFFDSALAREWVGVWPDSPAPPFRIAPSAVEGPT